MKTRANLPALGPIRRLAVSLFVGLVGLNALHAQEKLPLPTPVSPAVPAAPTESPKPSQVFPDGGFPSSPPAPEGNIPAATVKAGALYPPPILPSADHASTEMGTPEAQEGPAAQLFHSIAPPLPDYYYQPSYYDSSGLGARPIADYGPPGYEEREFHDAPGAPEFTLITPPDPVTPRERQTFVTRGMFPGSFLVPGTNTSFRFRGFVRFAGMEDFDPIGSRDDFVTNTIPVPQRTGENNNFSARYSRIGLDTWTPTTFLSWNVHTFIEADFFNGPAQAVGGGGNPFRLRFAFVDFGYFRVGQQNTVFMDSSAFPSTVDFAGPRGLANLRRASARMTLPICDKLFWAVGIEQPFSDITTNGLGGPVQDIPDFATHLRYQSDLGHVQLSTLVRSIGYRPTDGSATREAGWGFSASTVFHPWAALIGSNPVRKDNPTGLERSRILLQYTCGWGIGRYIQDTAGLGLDGQVDPFTGAFDTVFDVGWSASYEHWFNEKWLTNLTYSEVRVGTTSGQPGTTYSSAKYLATSLWWIPFSRMSIGAEFDWGDRQNLNEQAGWARRLIGLVQYNF